MHTNDDLIMEEQAKKEKKFDWKNLLWLALGVLLGMGIPDFIAGIIQGLNSAAPNP